MNVCIKCNSILLQKSLENFLKPYLSTVDRCDVIISDERFNSPKPLIYISQSTDADIVKPFSKEQLYDKLKLKSGVKSSANSTKYDELEMKIKKLTVSYVKAVLKCVKDTYEE